MTDHPSLKTSISLLDRLRLAPADDAAWEEFVRRYAPPIYDWCRNRHLQDADARDVTQSVLIKMVRGFHGFRRDRRLSFRKWLWMVTRRAWLDFLDDRNKANSLGKPGFDQFDQVATPEDLLARLDRQFDRELFEEASVRVRLRVEPRTWEAFRLTAIESMSGADASVIVAMSVTAIFKAKSKVLKMLREELARLDNRNDGFEEEEIA